jgi:hypothetical protein
MFLSKANLAKFLDLLPLTDCHLMCVELSRMSLKNWLKTKLNLNIETQEELFTDDSNASFINVQDEMTLLDSFFEKLNQNIKKNTPNNPHNYSMFNHKHPLEEPLDSTPKRMHV